MDENLITVIMPVYNEIRFLPSAIKSILDQTELRFILIIIDDGSTDGSAEYLKEIISDKVKVYFPGKQGLIKTLNYGLSLVETPFTAIMDADDISHPLRFERELKLLQNNKEISIVGTSVEYFGTNDYGRSIKVKMPKNDLEIRKGLEKRDFVLVHPTIMFRSSLIDRLDGYSEDSFPNPDYDFFLRASSFCKFENITDLNNKIRFHKESHTFSMLPQIIRKLSESSVKNNRNEKSSIFNLFYIALQNLKIILRSFSVSLYRKGILNYVNDKVVLGVMYLIFAGIISPLRGLSFLKNKISFNHNLF